MLGKQIKATCDEKSYLEYIENLRKIVDFDISQVMSKVDDLGLCEKIKYVLGNRGKRLRPILVLLSAQSVGGRSESVRKLALAMEMLHAASLIHDDILDQEILRRNKPTANVKWGIREAVLVGDALASFSLYLSAAYDNEIVKKISRTCMLIADGEYLDVKEVQYTRKESEYIEAIRRKSASLFKAATQCGAIAAKAKPCEVNALSAFGENFGLAYQIKDDILDIYPLKDNLPQDIKIFRATLPIIHLRETVKLELKEKLFQAITEIDTQNSTKKRSTIKLLLEQLECTGSLRYCSDKINHYVANAILSLESLKESKFKKYLFEIANSLTIL